jgi:hypothetical protein
MNIHLGFLAMSNTNVLLSRDKGKTTLFLGHTQEKSRERGMLNKIPNLSFVDKSTSKGDAEEE